MTSDSVLARLAGRVIGKIARMFPGNVSRQAIHDDDPSEDDIESMFNAHVSSHLAAVPRAYLALVPPDLADLIREAKAFHEVMDTRGAENEAELARSEVGFCPRYHVKLRLGPNAGHYLAIPTKMRCDYGNNIEAEVERAQIKRAGAIVVDVFGDRVRRESTSAT
jgi:hypothetical protein